MLSHLHALETIGTHINVVTANVRDLRKRLKQTLYVLKVAHASLKDTLQHGIKENQRKNITRFDLPLIEKAINLLEQSAITEDLDDGQDGPVACGGLLKGEDLDDDPNDEFYPTSQV